MWPKMGVPPRHARLQLSALIWLVEYKQAMANEKWIGSKYVQSDKEKKNFSLGRMTTPPTKELFKYWKDGVL